VSSGEWVGAKNIVASHAARLHFFPPLGERLVNTVRLPGTDGIANAAASEVGILSCACSISVSEAITCASCDLLRVDWGRICAAVRARVVATAGPCVFPRGPAVCAFVEIDEGRLTVGLMVPLVIALLPFLRQRCGLWLGLQRRMLKSAYPR
jgi:hypothetical protein